MVTTVTAAGGSATVAATSLALIAILTLLALLIQKEIVGGIKGARARSISRALNIAIVPLIIVFIATIAAKVVETLR